MREHGAWGVTEGVEDARHDTTIGGINRLTILSNFTVFISVQGKKVKEQLYETRFISMGN